MFKIGYTALVGRKGARLACVSPTEAITYINLAILELVSLVTVYGRRQLL